MTQAALPLDPVLQTTATLYHGDCLEVMPTLEKGSVAMVFADLPYGHTACHWDEIIDSQAFIAASKPLLTQEKLYVFTASLPLFILLHQQKHMRFRYDLTWFKTRLSGHLQARKAPMRAHENIFVFFDKQPTYNPQMRRNETGRKGNFIAGEPKQGVWGLAKQKPAYQLGQPLLPHSVVQVASPNSERGMHPTQKPVALLEWLIATYTNPGDTVLDPVFGSCTTGVACARLGRNFVGIEKDAGYFATGTERLNKERAALWLTAAEVVV